MRIGELHKQRGSQTHNCRGTREQGYRLSHHVTAQTTQQQQKVSDQYDIQVLSRHI